MMIRLEEHTNHSKFPFLNLGFRPFFFAAGLVAVLSMIIWYLMYQHQLLSADFVLPQLWHAHEMIFAYAMAVIAGFLLTAVKNWTGIQTIHGLPLLLLFILWLLARLLPFVAHIPLPVLAVMDVSFLLLVCIFVMIPIIKARSWNNIGIVSKLFLMALAHTVYYLGVLGVLKQGIHWGLYAGFYLVLALIFVMARRVVPFFIEKGLGLQQPLTNYLWLDRASLVLFLLFAIAEIFYPGPSSFTLAGLLFILHSIRLYHWYHPQIWQKTLLWSLYLAYMFITSGFLLKAMSWIVPISYFIPVHAFALGIGMITISMMSRVSLGHTGRNVFDPPKALFWVFLIMAITFVIRVVLPLLLPEAYKMWIALSQILWVIAFSAFSYLYFPMLFKARTDGRFG